MIIREPKMVRNDGEDFEVWSGGVLYIFKAGETRLLDGDTAYQILNHQKTPLVEVAIVAGEPVKQNEPVKPTEPEVKTDNAVDYNAMSYKELRTLATEKKVFKVGLSKEKLVELLNG